MTFDQHGVAEAPEALFRENLDLLDRVIARVCRRAGVGDTDKDDFASTVKLALIENDYAILRAWQQRSALATYLTVVIQRLLCDERTRTHGRWEPSAEARRAGRAAVLLETLVRRDKRPFDQALPLVQAVDPSLSRDDVTALLARLPERVPRPRPVPLDDVEQHIRTSGNADQALQSIELTELSARTSTIVRRGLAGLPAEDQAIVRLRFGSGISIADISRILRLPQRPLYRRIESILQGLRKTLEDSAIDVESAGMMIGAAIESLDFGPEFGKSEGVPQSNAMTNPQARAE